MLSTNCTICFNLRNILSIKEKINKNGIFESLKLKLQYIVPEVVGIGEDSNLLQRKK